MLSSLFSGISGLITEGHAMSVIGNNVANVNTVGFKGSRATFSDMLYQSIFGTAGTSQVGRGVALTSVDTMFEQGSFESTNEPTDLAIGGRGFFIVRSPESQANSYTRAGQFRFDKEGYMVNPTGMMLQGRPIDRVTNTPFSVATDILISQAPSEPKATGFIGMAVNLQSDAPWKGTVGSVTGTSGLSEVAQSENQYPRPGTYTATVDSLAAAVIGHTGIKSYLFWDRVCGCRDRKRLRNRDADEQRTRLGRFSCELPEQYAHACFGRVCLSSLGVVGRSG